MATMSISLPDSLKHFVQEHANSSDYSNPSDYIRALIQADKHRATEGKLEQALLKGLISGPSVPVGSAFWKRLINELRVK